jgi:predicted enzyme related to lactoylglutathione lyase
MPAISNIPPGAPIWLDLSTSNLYKAAEFYGALFGWTVEKGDQAEFGGYSTALLDGARVGGMMPKMGDPEAEGMPDFWSIYFHTPDAAAASATIAANGGQAMLEPMEVGDYGTMGVFADPAGTVFGTWQPNIHDGYQVFGEAGAPCWFELMTLDYPMATTFYPAVLGLDVSDMSGAEHVGDISYSTLTVAGEEMAGIMDGTGEVPEGTPGFWSVYFGVDDTDAAAARAGELGGSVLMEPMDSSYGRFAVLADPMGAPFAVISVGNVAQAE